MSNVVQFLETLARNPKTLSAEEFAVAVERAELEPAARQALLERDASALNQAIGGRATMLCFIAPAENDEPQKEGEDDQREEDEPSDEPASKAA